VSEIYVVRNLLNSGEEWASIWDRLLRAQSGE
jgi:hypothetical protein